MSRRKPDTYDRARRLIMSDILQFFITRQWPEDNNRCYPSIHGFTPTGYGSTRQPVVGDLVILTAVQPSKWNIGWLHEIIPPSSSYRDTRYCIQSLEDQSLCNWGNVGISVMPTEHIRTRYRWTDRQFDFQRRLAKVFRKAGAYSLRLLETQFDGDAATITTNERYAFTREEEDKPEPFTYRINDWRKLTMPMMALIIKMMVEEEKRRSATHKAQKQLEKGTDKQ